MNGASPFGPCEYVTLHFSHDEEILIPRKLLEQSPVINDLIEKSHDKQVHIQDIASATFDNLVHFLSGNHQEFDPDKVKLMIEAARQLAGVYKLGNCN